MTTTRIEPVDDAGTAADAADAADAGDGSDRRPRIRRRTVVLIATAVVVLAALGTWLVGFSSVFGVGRVVVHGVPADQQDAVRRVAAVVEDTPLVRLDTAAVRARVETLPDVASAQVSTSMPSTVTITVTERVAVGIVQSGTGFRLVDRTGDQFRDVAARPRHLPLFVVPQGTDSRTTGGAVATVAAALPSSVRGRVVSIQAFDPNAITLVLANGRIVRWGSADRSADKARILPALLQRPAHQLDLTDPDHPFTR